MSTFISILRGINVSGQKKILMADLKTVYEKLEFTDVVTFIQSGNVIFNSKKKTTDEQLAKTIEQEIFRKYNFNVPVIIRTAEEMQKVVAANPFPKQRGVNIEKLHVTFLAEVPNETQLEGIKAFDFSPDKFLVSGKEVYLYTPGGYGNTKISNQFFENKLKVKATTRNWKTVNKLAELAMAK